LNSPVEFHHSLSESENFPTSDQYFSSNT
jgi:hypothetical protein